MKRVSTIIMVLTVAILIAIDIILLLTGGVEATFSRVILESSKKHPIISVAIGILIGHWFWPQPSNGKLISAAKRVLEWYDRDGSVGGADVVIEELRQALGDK